jgi:hypothetical protein
MGAAGIHKTIRSRSVAAKRSGERLYVIISDNLEGIAIYSKGKFELRKGIEIFYVLISGKRAR